MSEANGKDSFLHEHDEYVNGKVIAALAAEGITPASPGFHNARFVAAEAVRMTLVDMAMHEQGVPAVQPAEGVGV